MRVRSDEVGSGAHKRSAGAARGGSLSLRAEPFASPSLIIAAREDRYRDVTFEGFLKFTEPARPYGGEIGIMDEPAEGPRHQPLGENDRI
jgi:hypothetical protein